MGATTRKERLEQLLQLAQHYRGSNRRDLARTLGRSTSRLVPDSGMPKLDLIMDLTELLDWRVEDVVGHLWTGDASEAAPDERPFIALEQQARQAHREGRFHDAVRFAQAARGAAHDPEERARAAIREASAWDGLGRYTRAMDVTRRGLTECAATRSTRLALQGNLAGEYYTLWHLLEARTMAHDLVEEFRASPPSGKWQSATEAFAYYTRGHASRRLLVAEEFRAASHARAAADDLERARVLHEELAERFDDEAYVGIANTCLGGLYEVEAVLGVRAPEHVLSLYERGLGGLVEIDPSGSGDWLESYGWWCIFGCNVALRAVGDPKELQRWMALFTNKADEIAERLDNWSLRERVLAMDFARRERLNDWTGVGEEYTLDADDVRLISGAMGRFPSFQQIGWRILESAKVLDSA